ncbi:MAG: hypothetical protein AAGG07_04715 [Planctomycetota bacterium]
MDELEHGQIDRRGLIEELPPPSAFDPRPHRFGRGLAVVGLGTVIIGAIAHRLVMCSPGLPERLLAMAQHLVESLA